MYIMYNATTMTMTQTYSDSLPLFKSSSLLLWNFSLLNQGNFSLLNQGNFSLLTQGNFSLLTQGKRHRVEAFAWLSNQTGQDQDRDRNYVGSKCGHIIECAVGPDHFALVCFTAAVQIRRYFGSDGNLCRLTPSLVVLLQPATIHLDGICKQIYNKS